MYDLEDRIGFSLLKNGASYKKKRPAWQEVKLCKQNFISWKFIFFC